MNVLVTGANGFIGRVLCDKLIADGYQVRGAVRGQEKTGVGRKRDERPTSNIERPTLNEKQKKQRKNVGGLRAEVGDIGPETDWSEALSGIDGIVHLAAKTNPPADNDQNTLPISAQGTFW
jgi:nucleoside-diphosphate-sugar epimerase